MRGPGTMKLPPRGSLWFSNKTHTHTHQQPLSLGKTWNAHILWDSPEQLSNTAGRGAAQTVFTGHPEEA